MSSKAVKIIIEVLLAVVAATVLSFIPEQNWPVMIEFAIIPLIFVALRQGTIWGLMASILFGVVHCFVHPSGNGYLIVPLHDSLLAYGFVGIAGLFARNTVRTAFNARISSTVLNITTATIIVSFVNFMFHAIASTIGSPTLYQTQQIALVTSLTTTWPNLLATIIVSVVILVGLVYVKRSAYIPKGTRFLSRKEQSHLLND